MRLEGVWTSAALDSRSRAYPARVEGPAKRLANAPFFRPERSRLVELAPRPTVPAPREQRQPRRDRAPRQQTQRRTGFLRGQPFV